MPDLVGSMVSLVYLFHLEAIVENVLVHLDHGWTILRGVHSCPSIEEDIVDNSSAGFPSCMKQKDKNG
jgi:hypothetical protein